MALFKILSGLMQNDSTKKYAYFTPEDSKLYIDEKINNDGSISDSPSVEEDAVFPKYPRSEA